LPKCRRDGHANAHRDKGGAALPRPSVRKPQQHARRVWKLIRKRLRVPIRRHLPEPAPVARVVLRCACGGVFSSAPHGAMQHLVCIPDPQYSRELIAENRISTITFAIQINYKNVMNGSCHCLVIAHWQSACSMNHLESWQGSRLALHRARSDCAPEGTHRKNRKSTISNRHFPAHCRANCLSDVITSHYAKWCSATFNPPLFRNSQLLPPRN